MPPQGMQSIFSNSTTARPAAAPGLYDTGKNTVQLSQADMTHQQRAVLQSRITQLGSV